MWTESRHIGLLNWLGVTGWIAVIATFLLMDYAYWWWHWANHMIPLFWRFHNVHHTDLDLDVSTAARFHFGEMIFSIGFLSLAVIVFGISPLMLVAFFIGLEAATLFHHSNWRLPIKVERILNLIIVTPRMHGIHHSIVQRETNSNWGTIFCWWDQLQRTLRRDVPQDAVTIGTRTDTRKAFDAAFPQTTSVATAKRRVSGACRSTCKSAIGITSGTTGMDSQLGNAINPRSFRKRALCYISNQMIGPD